MAEFTILGAGLAGISSSYHISHENCVIYEKNSYPGGHIYSYQKDGFTWDEGPHVSFTKYDYVKNLFSENIKGKFKEYPVDISNYFKGIWIPHPAQSNLWAIPQPLRDICLKDFLDSRNQKFAIKNYKDWLIVAFGKAFYENFSKAYTLKNK